MNTSTSCLWLITYLDALGAHLATVRVWAVSRHRAMRKAHHTFRHHADLISIRRAS